MPLPTILRRVLSLPTAPFHEGRVMAFIEAFVSRRPGLVIDRDRWGNRRVRDSRHAPSPWVVVAHTDHPGGVVEHCSPEGMARVKFTGGVRPDFLERATFRFPFGRRVALGKVVAVARDAAGQVLLDVQLDHPVPRGTVAVPPFGVAVKGSRVSAPACDNLVSVACSLTVLDRLHRRGLPSPQFIFSRAEEAGFVGTRGMLESMDLLSRDASIVVLEASSAQPAAPRGCGVIVRVGDRTGSFDPGILFDLSHKAATLAAAAPNFRFLRALMPGGTCEATPFVLAGLRSACLCVPLENYHNMNTRTGRLDAEAIGLDDFQCMVALVTSLAEPTAGREDLADRLLRLTPEQRRDLLEPIG